MNNDISQKLRLAIKSKLTTLDAYIDDEVGFQLYEKFFTMGTYMSATLVNTDIYMSASALKHFDVG